MQPTFSESQKSRTLPCVVRLTEPSDAGGVAALQAACFPPPFPPEALFNERHVLRHIERFPEGQLVALADGQVVGSATNMLMSAANWAKHEKWVVSVGGLDISRHDPQGSVLFGVDISVAPDHRRSGVGRALYTARFDLVRALGLDFYGTVCRLPGFAVSGARSPAEYAGAVASGVMQDRTLTPLLRLGMSYRGVVEDYMDDVESGDAGAVLEWRP